MPSGDPVSLAGRGPSHSPRGDSAPRGTRAAPRVRRRRLCAQGRRCQALGPSRDLGTWVSSRLAVLWKRVQWSWSLI